MLDRPPSAAALRARARWQRDYRARQRNGEAIAPVPYDTDVIEFLIATRWLDPAQADDRRPQI